jgi:hypothetical protein
MNELKQLILGELSIAYYMAAGFFSCLAILLSLYMHSRTRDKNSTATPEKFSWRFLLWDNAKRVFAGMILMFLFFRFSPDLFGRPLSMWLAVGIGFFVSVGVDRAIQFIQSKFPDILKNR